MKKGWNENMSDNGRRYAPKDATPRSQNSREFQAESFRRSAQSHRRTGGLAGLCRQPRTTARGRKLCRCTLRPCGTQSEKGSEGAQEKKPCKGQKKQAHFRVHVACHGYSGLFNPRFVPDWRLQRFSRCRPHGFRSGGHDSRKRDAGAADRHSLQEPRDR